MAWLESCMCFDLFTASIVVGLVTVVIYLVAFAVELWWIIDSNASLPIPAYILCVGYFIIFFTSVIMIAGMIGQTSKCLLVWLFVIVILFVPEGGIVLFMSIIHWTLRHKYGLTELIFWVCRAVLDIVAVIVVQSQYSAWKNNKQVLRRLQSLHLSGAITDTVLKEGQFSNGYLPSTTTPTGAYENLGFISTADVRPSATNGQLPPLSNNRMQRSLSSASQLVVTHPNSLHNGGSLPTDRMHLDDWPYLQSARTTGTLNSSNNSHFDAAILEQRYSFPVKSSASIERQPSDLQTYRPRSLMYLDEDDYLTRPPPSRAVSLGYVNLNPDYSTQSLDRSRFQKMAGRRRTTSLDALDMRMRPDVQLHKVAMEPFDYLNRPGSKQSDLDDASDNLPNLNDVAL